VVHYTEMQIASLKFSKLSWVIVAFHFIATLLALPAYIGSAPYLLLFSFAFCLLFVLLIQFRSRLTFFFLVLMLWVGFWLKFIAHHLISYPYLDFMGRFLGTAPEWDKVLLVSSLGALGLCIPLIFSKNQTEDYTAIPLKSEKRNGISKLFLVLFTIIVTLVFLTVFVNFYYGLTLSGIAAITTLPFKLNAITGWLMYVGLSLVIAFFARFENSQRSGLQFSIFLVFWESALSSISIISRGLYLFHSIPFLYVAFLNYKSLGIKIRNLIIIGLTFVVLFVFTSHAVSAVRFRLYGKEILQVEKYNPAVLLEKNTYKNKASYSFSQISSLVIDRWIGLEGVMSVTTYPEKNFDLLIHTFFNKLKIGEVDVYAKICLSDYNQTKAYSFMSLPGILAFLFYSDSLFFLFLAMIFIGWAVLKLDYLVYRSFKNPFISAQIGFFMANSIAQFGVSPRPLFISVFMSSCFLVGSYFLLRYGEKNHSKFNF
jgi:hypothetical protein